MVTDAAQTARMAVPPPMDAPRVRRTGLPSAAVDPIETRLLERLIAIRELYNEYFDRGWLTTQLDDLPLDRVALRHIRDTLGLSVIYASDLPDILYCAESLQSLVEDLRRYLLPTLRDRLGISGLSRARSRLDPITRLHRELLSQTLPGNLDRLEHLTGDLVATLVAA
ncbi:MAG: hypothetical protein EA382_13715 [Spirochaetaceae bacterium]|nr:MAG: hypothetical protein EA382_13715 [Spirochaetaceae bacterium]